MEDPAEYKTKYVEPTLLENITKDTEALKSLQLHFYNKGNLLAARQTFELLKDETEEKREALKKANEEAHSMGLALRMLNLEVGHKTAYQIKKLFDLINEKGQEFTIKDIAKIQAKASEIFGE